MLDKLCSPSGSNTPGSQIVAESFSFCSLGSPAAPGAVVGTKSRKAVSPGAQGQQEDASKLGITRTDRARPSVPGLLPGVVRLNILSSWEVRAPRCPLKYTDETSTPPQPWQRLTAAPPCPILTDTERSLLRRSGP